MNRTWWASSKKLARKQMIRKTEELDDHSTTCATCSSEDNGLCSIGLSLCEEFVSARDVYNNFDKEKNC